MFDAFWLRVEASFIAGEIGATWLFPLIESLHVLSITLMLGAILMLDLRLLGWAAKSYSIESLSRELIPWSAIAFVFACATGVGMFITRASAHVENPAFQIKMILIVLAGLNIAYCHFRVLPALRLEEGSVQVIRTARVCGALSLLLWIGTVLAGRWVGHII